jgi:aerobic-type carbon monoxide dehydrogenase small subunit (CoxS/CutS family)
VRKRRLRRLYGARRRLAGKIVLMLTAEAVGKQITTVEGLKNAPIQKAFIEKFAFQCGYCTSGFLMVCHALSAIHPNPPDIVIDEWLQSISAAAQAMRRAERHPIGIIGRA